MGMVCRVGGYGEEISYVMMAMYTFCMHFFFSLFFRVCIILYVVIGLAVVSRYQLAMCWKDTWNGATSLSWEPIQMYILLPCGSSPSIQAACITISPETPHPPAWPSHLKTELSVVSLTWWFKYSLGGHSTSVNAVKWGGGSLGTGVGSAFCILLLVIEWSGSGMWKGSLFFSVYLSSLTFYCVVLSLDFFIPLLGCPRGSWPLM